MADRDRSATFYPQARRARRRIPTQQTNGSRVTRDPFAHRNTCDKRAQPLLQKFIWIKLFAAPRLPTKMHLLRINTRLPRDR
ncbi:hypothetical protein X946_5472 [Burkholderia sp. ABCPW 111]|nr:hypothetical protein X946_5472 [Burkholderia sp. ABCPW 111]